jgi:hypothetical protein
VKIFHVKGGELEEISEAEFYEGDVYVVDAGITIFIWRGKESTIDEKFTAAWLCNKMDMERKDYPHVITCEQNEEPEELIELLGGAPKVKSGGTPGFLKTVEGGIEEFKPKLYRAIGHEEFEEVELSRESLNSDSALVLDSGLNIYVWIGRKASSMEKFEAGRIGRKLDSERKFVPQMIVIYEGEEEPPKFKELLK